MREITKGPQDQTPVRLAYSVAELAEMTSLSNAFLRNEIRDGKLKVKRLGRRVLVLLKDAEDYLSRLA